MVKVAAIFEQALRPAGNPQELRLAALRRFAAGITVLTLLGHLYLGFEQSWLQIAVSMATCYSTELLLESLEARTAHRSPRFIARNRNLRARCFALLNFLLPAHITSLAVTMLLYAGGRLGIFVFAGIFAIASKRLIRLRPELGGRHIMNPSNAGITATLLLFPSVSIAPPYQFTENVDTLGDWSLPCIFLLAGTFVNYKFTGRLPLIVGWLGGFVLQAAARAALADANFAAALMPMTGVAFLLFTFYMVTDPATTPRDPLNQFGFGLSVAGAYGILTALHVAFGLFFALAAVCGARFVLQNMARSGYLVSSTATMIRLTSKE